MRFLFYLICICIACAGYAADINDTLYIQKARTINSDSTKVQCDTIIRLCDADYRRVAEELGIEVATMKSVVEVEAGITHKGFCEPKKPILNFDVTIFKKFLRKKGFNYKKHLNKEAFKKINIRKYGSYCKAQWARFESACKIDSTSAKEASFWGMFQIGGFNWKKCGCSSINEFIQKMSESEAMQLELFAQYCINNNLVKYIQKKDWHGFSYRYNGPSYKSKGYHKKLKYAYKKHKIK